MQENLLTQKSQQIIMLVRSVVSASLLLLLTALAFCSLSILAIQGSISNPTYFPQTERKVDIVSFSFTIEIYVEDINYAEKSASITIWASIRDCNYQNATAITIIFNGDASVLVECERMGSDYYWGHSDIDWPMRGNGELYPFDFYSLRFIISRQFYLKENQGVQLVYPNATFNTFFSSSNIEPIASYAEFETTRFLVRLERNSSLPILQLLLPITLCYFILGGSLLIPRSKLSDRLRVYLSLFCFWTHIFVGHSNLSPPAFIIMYP